MRTEAAWKQPRSSIGLTCVEPRVLGSVCFVFGRIGSYVAVCPFLFCSLHKLVGRRGTSGTLPKTLSFACARDRQVRHPFEKRIPPRRPAFRNVSIRPGNSGRTPYLTGLIPKTSAVSPSSSRRWCHDCCGAEQAPRRRPGRETHPGFFRVMHLSRITLRQTLSPPLPTRLVRWRGSTVCHAQHATGRSSAFFSKVLVLLTAGHYPKYRATFEAIRIYCLSAKSVQLNLYPLRING